MSGYEEELEMLVGMGFDRKAVKRAMEANGGNMHQALSDLTSGEELPPPATTDNNGSRRSIQPNDRGLNSLVVPTREDNGEEQRSESKSRRKKSSKRKASHHRRRARQHDEGQQQQRAPTQRISEFDVTNETGAMQPQTSERRSIATGSWVESTVADNQSNAVPVQLNQSGTLPNGQRASHHDSANAWPSAAWPGTNGEAAPATPTNHGQQTFDNSSPRLSAGPPAVEAQLDGSMSRMSASGQDSFVQGFNRSVNAETINYQEGAPADPYAITAVVTDEEEGTRTYPEYTPRSSSVARGSGTSGGNSFDLSWCQPSYSFGFLVFIGIILVVPAVVITLAFLIPRQVAPKATYQRLDQVLTKLLNESSLDGGIAMATPDTPQNRAFNWLYNSAQPHTDGRSYESTGAQIGTITNGSVFSLPYGNDQTRQRYAMATLYYSTSGESWSTRDGWLDETTNECLDWFHRYTAEFCAGGSVVNLDLTENNLQGTITDELSIFSGTLKSLSLGSNLLTESIPASIGLLTNLESLDLSNNNLQGTVPIQMQNLTNLEFLYLVGNQLTGEYTCSDLIPNCYVSCTFDNETCRSL